jgi:hypothetical protein
MRLICNVDTKLGLCSSKLKRNNAHLSGILSPGLILALTSAAAAAAASAAAAAAGSAAVLTPLASALSASSVSVARNIFPVILYSGRAGRKGSMKAPSP